MSGEVWLIHYREKLGYSPRNYRSLGRWHYALVLATSPSPAFRLHPIFGVAWLVVLLALIVYGEVRLRSEVKEWDDAPAVEATRVTKIEAAA